MALGLELGVFLVLGLLRCSSLGFRVYGTFWLWCAILEDYLSKVYFHGDQYKGILSPISSELDSTFP